MRPCLPAIALVVVVLTGCGMDAADPSVTDTGTTGRTDPAPGSGSGEGTGSGSQPEDADLDGFDAETDCNDADGTIFPGAPEICDAVDNDCDGTPDDGLAYTQLQDADGDGYGNDALVIESCHAEAGYTTVAGDCDDARADTNPAASEVCDALDHDEDCDSLSDEADPSLSDASAFFVDADLDGFGDPTLTEPACDLRSGLSDVPGDCDDTRGDIHPDANEICDGSDLDEDCDGDVDEDDADSDVTLVYPDTDLDGFGDAGAFPIVTCEPMADGVDNNDDCDDLHDTAFPGGTEDCWDDVDNDCDGSFDECKPAWPLALADAPLVITGSTYTYTGQDVAEAGDIDGDGTPDLMIGSPGSNGCGSIHFWLGPATGSLDLTTADLAIDGSAYGGDFGQSISGGSDVDGDGYSDVLVAEADTSQVHLFYGPLSGSTDAAAADLVLFGTGGTGFGYRVSLLGDTSGDGIGDLAVTSTAYDGATGNEGAVHVLHGGWMGDVDLAADYALRLQGDAGDDALGESLGERGDLDGDGLMEIIVGSALNDDAGVSAGKVYVIAGDGSTGERDVGTGALATMTGAAAGDTFGTSVTGGFDYDADGYEDLAVGAPLYDSAFEADAGGAFVFLGPVSGDVSAASAYAIWYGEGLQDKLGASVDGGGDPNLDGNEDLLVGGISYNGGSYDKGVVYVVFGPTGGVMGLVDAQAKLEGESWTGYAGSSVAWLSDWDGDLQDEAIIGSNGYASTTSKQGRVYVVDGASIFH